MKLSHYGIRIAINKTQMSTKVPGKLQTNDAKKELILKYSLAAH